MKKIFEKIKGFFGKLGKKKTIAIIVILVIVFFVVFSIVRTKRELEEATNVRSGSVETIETRAIANSISGTGVIDSESMEEVMTDFEGYATGTPKITKVNVEVGSVVNAGDVICTFDTADLVDQKHDIEKQLARAQKRRTKTADKQVERDEEFDKQIAKEEKNKPKNLARMEKNIHRTETSLNDARYEYYDAYNQYLAAQQNLDPNDPVSVNQLDLSKKNLDAKSERVDTLEEQLENYTEQYWELYEADEAQDLRDDKADYDDTTADSIEDLDDQIDDLQDSLNDINHNINACTIKCKNSGTVTAVNVKEGSSFNGSMVAVIEGVETFVVEAEIDEYDIADIDLGMKVLVRTDATRDTELRGTVISIAPRAVGTGENDMSGFSNFAAGMDFSSFSGSSKKSAKYKVKIGSLEQNDRLRLGMNCKVSILTEEEEEAISVPFDALQTDDDGNYFIEIVTSGEAPEDPDFETKEVKVKVGIEGSYYVEVISDEVKEGMKVFVPSSGNSTTLDDLLTNMGSDAGV